MVKTKQSAIPHRCKDASIKNVNYTGVKSNCFGAPQRINEARTCPKLFVQDGCPDKSKELPRDVCPPRRPSPSAQPRLSNAPETKREMSSETMMGSTSDGEGGRSLKSTVCSVCLFGRQKPSVDSSMSSRKSRTFRGNAPICYGGDHESHRRSGSKTSKTMDNICPSRQAGSSADSRSGARGEARNRETPRDRSACLDLPSSLEQSSSDTTIGTGPCGLGSSRTAGPLSRPETGERNDDAMTWDVRCPVYHASTWPPIRPVEEEEEPPSAALPSILAPMEVCVGMTSDTESCDCSEQPSHCNPCNQLKAQMAVCTPCPPKPPPHLDVCFCNRSAGVYPPFGRLYQGRTPPRKEFEIEDLLSIACPRAMGGPIEQGRLIKGITPAACWAIAARGVPCRTLCDPYVMTYPPTPTWYKEYLECLFPNKTAFGRCLVAAGPPPPSVLCTGRSCDKPPKRKKQKPKKKKRYSEPVYSEGINCDFIYGATASYEKHTAAVCDEALLPGCPNLCTLRRPSVVPPPIKSQVQSQESCPAAVKVSSVSAPKAASAAASVQKAASTAASLQKAASTAASIQKAASTAASIQKAASTAASIQKATSTAASIQKAASTAASVHVSIATPQVIASEPTLPEPLEPMEAKSAIETDVAGGMGATEEDVSAAATESVHATSSGQPIAFYGGAGTPLPVGSATTAVEMQNSAFVLEPPEETFNSESVPEPNAPPPGNEALPLQPTGSGTLAAPETSEVAPEAAPEPAPEPAPEAALEEPEPAAPEPELEAAADPDPAPEEG